MVKRFPDRDALIAQGLSLTVIGQTLGVERETIRQYILRTHQHDLYLKAQEEKRLRAVEQEQVIRHLVHQINSPLEDLISQIMQVGFNPADQGMLFAYKKTQAFFDSLKNSNKVHSFSQLYDLFLAYHEAYAQGEKISLSTLAKNHGFYWEASVGHILRQVHLPPLAKPPKKRRVLTSGYQKEVLKRAVPVAMSLRDLAYFIGVEPQVVYSFFKEKGFSEQRPTISYPIPYGEPVHRLTYLKASQIYEAVDAQFSMEEIICSSKNTINRRLYDHVLKHRQEIGRHIMRSLGQLFPDKEFTTPYVTFKIQ